MICPICSFVKENTISNLVYFGFNCNFCSESRSIGEKFLTEILRFNKINFTFDKSFNWSDRKRYDFYLPNHNVIIETHGSQHYNQGFEGLGGRSLKEEQENDIYKLQLAKENGIKNYIVLDFRNSDFEYMMNSICKCYELLNILNKDTNFQYCYENALTTKSNFNKAIDIFNTFYNIDGEPKNFHIYVKHICKTLGITKTTATNYLTQGSKVGLCNYNGLASIKAYKRSNQRKVYCEELNIVFDSISKCAEYFNTNRSTIGYYIDGKAKKRNKYKKKYTLIAL